MILRPCSTPTSGFLEHSRDRGCCYPRYLRCGLDSLELKLGNLVVAAVSASGRTSHSLFTVSRDGYLHTVRSLIQSGADLNTRDNKEWTPLLAASQYGCRNNTRDPRQWCIRHKCPEHARGRCSRWTPLQFAIRFGCLDVVQLLIDHGERSRTSEPTLHSYHTAVMSMAVRLLLVRGADVDAQNKKT
jgi:hypothetical protein